MSLRSRIEKLEERLPPRENQLPVIALSVGFVFPLPAGTKLKPGERIVTDTFQRRTVSTNWKGEGTLFEFADTRQRVTSDPDDNGRDCGPDSQLDDVLAELYPARTNAAPVLDPPALQPPPLDDEISN